MAVAGGLQVAGITALVLVTVLVSLTAAARLHPAVRWSRTPVTPVRAGGAAGRLRSVSR